MGNRVFGKTYSSLYDSLYEAKPYEAECDFLEEIFRRHKTKVRSILDLGCGTAGHMIPLIKRGYEVVGVDQSSSMLEGAKNKIAREGLSAELIQKDIISLKLNRRFDAVVSMFSVVGYFTANAKVSSFCQTLKKHINPSGIAVFDAWHGSAVLFKRPQPRTRTISREGQKIIRTTEPVLDVIAQTVDTRFDIKTIEKGRVVSRTKEAHKVRYFFPQEFDYYCKTAGFRRVNFYPFLNVQKSLTEEDWYFTIVCR